MEKLITILFVGLSVGCATQSTKSVNTALGKETTVIVKISGIKNSNGNLVLAIHDNNHSYRNGENLNDANYKPIKLIEVPAKPPEMQVTIRNILSGKYAIDVFHDENSDRKFNRMIFPFTGMPSESYGITNNVYSWFSKAPFEEALIKVNAPSTTIEMVLSHHLKKITGKK